VILSPLTLDLDGDGMVETTSKENSGVYFDHDNNSFAEQSGCISIYFIRVIVIGI
jgi:hypothetical protein